MDIFGQYKWRLHTVIQYGQHSENLAQLRQFYFLYPFRLLVFLYICSSMKTFTAVLKFVQWQVRLGKTA